MPLAVRAIPDRRRAPAPRAVILVVLTALVATFVTTVTRIQATQSRRGQQWALDTVDFGAVHADVTGAGIIVAVLDTGISAGHQDLVGKIIGGYDFVEDRPFDPFDADRQTAVSDHGTMVASIIAAPHDEIGIDGAAPGVRVMPVRIVPDSTQGTAGDMASGIEWALDNGADIINISIRTGRDSTAVRLAVERADAMGVPVVASAGLAPTELKFYPAAYESTIAVAALDDDLNPYSGSPKRAYVDVAAPGVGILAAGGSRPDLYRVGSGTSFAAPHVTAAIALAMVSSNGDAARAVDVVMQTAVDLGQPGRDDVFGMGLIDPLAAHRSMAPVTPNAPANVSATGFGNRMLVSWTAVEHASRYDVVVDGAIFATSSKTFHFLRPARYGHDRSIGVRTRADDGTTSDLVLVQGPRTGNSARVELPKKAPSNYWICDRCFPSDLDRWRGD